MCDWVTEYAVGRARQQDGASGGSDKLTPNTIGCYEPVLEGTGRREGGAKRFVMHEFGEMDWVRAGVQGRRKYIVVGLNTSRLHHSKPLILEVVDVMN